MTSPRVTCLTPPGSAAIAVLAITGAAAWHTIRPLFRPAGRPLPDAPPPDGVWFGRIGPESGDEVILSAPSPGDLPTVEIHCHGGRQMVRTLIDLLVASGCVEETVGEPLSAWDLLPHAKTMRTAAILLDQANGAFDRALHAAKNDPAVARRLLDLAPVGLHLVEPWKVVIAGAPNAGKSSLLNALAGYQRSIVTPVAGTTRDVVTVSLAFDGWPVDVSDTAGLHQTSNEIEQAGIRKAYEQIHEADLCILLIDATAPAAVPRELFTIVKRLLQVVNKIDLAQPPTGQHLTISAQTVVGIDVLMAEVIRTLLPAVPEPGEGVPYTADHVTAVRQLLNQE